MAEAACVLHAFTFPSYEAKQVGEVDGLQESVSFGRFATETLAWDKWSSFSNKRYVEEAAKHSHPGLVAKKKAFFEAYYKKKALLEQENAAEGILTVELDAEDGNLNVTYPSSETVASEKQDMNVSGQDGVGALETDLGLKSVPLDVTYEEVSDTGLVTCTIVNATILSDKNTNQEVPEVNAEKMVPACPQLPSVLRASSKRAYSDKEPRMTFGPSTKEMQDSKNLQEDLKLETSATALTEAKRTKTLLNIPASKSRRSRTDLCTFSASSKEFSESKSPIISISSPFGFGTGKGIDRNREKLEEILNSKASKRVRFQTKIKEKAASQLKKLGLGFCFSSKPSPNLQHQSQALKNKSKISVACIQLEKHRTSMKSGCWKHVEKQRSQRQIRPGSLGEVISLKGKSPTAQIL